MRVLITGATGFIGRALALRLLRDRHAVSAWVRDPARARGSLGAEVKLIAARDDAALDAAVREADAVVNLAGEPIIGKRWTDAHKKVLLGSRVELSRRIAQAIARAEPRPSVLITASAVGFYGDRGDALLEEDAPAGGGFLSDICVAWEGATDSVEGLVRRARLRIGLVLGPGGGALEKMLTPFKLGAGGRIASGQQWWPWVHLEDVVEVVARALVDERYRGAINVVAPEPLRNRDFTAALARAVRRPALVPVPRAALELGLGEAACALLWSQRVVPRALEAWGHPFLHPSIDEALASVVSPRAGVSVGLAGSPPANAYTTRRRPRYLLAQDTALGAPIEEVFEFFSRAENLGAITPPTLAFDIRTPAPIPMGSGTVIDYRIALGGLPMRWRTVIHDWAPGQRFTDAQERGPYAAWWHEHHFEADGARTRMADRVYYAPPLGPLGWLAHALFVRRTLEGIFAYRAFAIRLRFG